MLCQPKELLTRENSSTADAVHEDDCRQGTQGLWREDDEWKCWKWNTSFCCHDGFFAFILLSHDSQRVSCLLCYVNFRRLFCKNKVPVVIYSKIFFILCTFLPSSLSLLIFKGFRNEDMLTTGWFLVYEICLHSRYLSVTGFHSQAVVPETDWWGSSLRPDLKLVVRPHQTVSQDHHQHGESFFQPVTTLGITWKTLC